MFSPPASREDKQHCHHRPTCAKRSCPQRNGMPLSHNFEPFLARETVYLLCFAPRAYPRYRPHHQPCTVFLILRRTRPLPNRRTLLQVLRHRPGRKHELHGILQSLRGTLPVKAVSRWLCANVWGACTVVFSGVLTSAFTIFGSGHPPTFVPNGTCGSRQAEKRGSACLECRRTVIPLTQKRGSKAIHIE